MMKNTFLLLAFTLILSGTFAQTAVNFNCNDCMGVNHDLFSELDEGKVIVICWVMPCGACVGPALTTYNVVRSFQSSHPDKVFMYLVDDYANTNCSSLNSWANSYNISDVTLFSNAAINMEDYGSTGMPKIVVVADVNHYVFYNANNSVNATQLQSAINEAITATITGINETPDKNMQPGIYPNPSTSIANVDFRLAEPSGVQVEVFDFTGKEIREFYFGNFGEGKNSISFTTAELNSGIYFLKLHTGTQSRMMKFVVSN
jgi:hypothetical protein